MNLRTAATVGVLLAGGLLALGGGPKAETAGPSSSGGPGAAVAETLVVRTASDPGLPAARTEGGLAVAEDRSDSLAVATFAGGCFWCVEEAFEALDGVTEAVSGYTGGHVEDPGYERVSTGRTGHYEAVRVRYEPDRVGYERLLEVFWRNVDPTDAGGQFCDRGPQYRTAIFVHDEEQRAAAERSKRRLQEGGAIEEEIVTPILEAGSFWPAEDYHQDYYREHRVRYQVYKAACGRNRTLKELWGEEAGG